MPDQAPEPVSRRLLVVDDEAIQRLLVTRAAATLGILADGAASLEEAISLIHVARYDAVVLDLGLRDHDGVELLRHLRQAESEAILVFISAFDERVRQAAARLAGALGLRVAGTLGKPLDLQRLISLLSLLPEHVGPYCSLAPPEIDPALLECAIDSPEISLVFQPKVNLATRRICGMEVLTRWRSPILGRVGPNRFIPLAERSGLIDRLTWRILGDSLSLFRNWLSAWPDLSIAVNLSPVSLNDLRLPERISKILEQSGVPPTALVLEVTEGAVMADYVAAADILTRLRIRGIRLSIDDFGTGHSSLLSLLHLPFSELKIDQSFVRTALIDPEAPKILRAVVSLARELGLQTVAEGIETEPTAQLLTRLGCDVGQGYLFAPPLSREALEAQMSAPPGVAPLGFAPLGVERAS